MKVPRYSRKNFSLNKEAVAGGLLLAGGALIHKRSKKKLDKIFDSEISKEQKDHYDKIKKEIQDRGVTVIDDIPFSSVKNAAYASKDKKSEEIIKRDRKKIEKQIKDYEERINKDYEKDPQKKEKALNDLNVLKSCLKIGGKGGYIVDKDLHRGDIMSHERGHEYYLDGEGRKKIGGILHRADKSPILNMGIVDKSLAFASGINSSLDPENESAISKYGYLALPGLRAVSKVGSEAAASIRGYKQLKKSGASKETLKESKKALKNALGTYIGNSMIDLGSSLAMRAWGKNIGKNL